MDGETLTQRQILLKAMEERPSDPWPKGDGHVVLAEPGSPREAKAYHEPGGLFSPAPGSFGVSFWTLDGNGRRIIAAEELPAEKIEQSFVWNEEGAPPSILTKTHEYSCRWTYKGPGRWHCELKPSKDSRTAVYVRSAGPAGGPIERLDWDGRRLLVNRRWSLKFKGHESLKALLGDEGKGKLGGETGIPSIDSPDGWACARVEAGGNALEIEIRDWEEPGFKTPLSFKSVKSGLRLELPSGDFVSSLEAQAAHLLMGFVGRQTRPGEPTNYPLEWERDGAYAVAAMARAGQIETAKELCERFAENDFFGGFGAEGDAPGSAINAIVETALASGDVEFQREVWPHIKRKAAIIREMAEAKEVIRKPWTGPIVPIHRGKGIIPVICEAAKDGLIQGTMDNHFPVLYVNAISSRGLAQAAKLAKRLGEKGEALEFAALSAKLKSAWRANFGRAELSNERTFISAVWPTWTGSPEDVAFRAALQSRWDKDRAGTARPKPPLWTYFSVAEAHQWLLLGEPEKAWEVLRYFWARQSSPGLYSCWEGDGEENSFALWEGIRGWAKPKCVTPHYWTAAETLLLQLDMLAYVDESKEEPELVVGAGIPESWAKEDLSVDGLRSSFGEIAWSWSKGRLKASLRGGRKLEVRAGRAFGAKPEIETEFMA